MTPPSGSGNTKRTVYGSRISSRDPGLKFQWDQAGRCLARIYSSQLSLTMSALKISPLMKRHPLAERHLQGLVIQPLPGGGEAWHQLAILVDLHQVLEDVPRNPRPVQGSVSTIRSSPRGIGLWSPTLMVLTRR